MTDLATLGIGVDSTQVTQGATALDKLATAGGQTELQTAKLTGAFSNLNLAIKNFNTYTAAGLTDLEAFNRLSISQAAALKANVDLYSQLSLEKTLDTSATGLNTAAIVENTAALETHGFKLKNAGLATREFGYAVKDILTGNTQLLYRELGSLAASQGAFNGLLSLTALGIVALVAPFAVLITAMIQGENETTKLNQAISKTGNYAGATAGEVEKASQLIGAATDISTGKIRNQLAEVIGLGKNSIDSAEKMVQAADSFGEAYGINKEKVLKDFEDQKGGIVKWAVKHEEAYHDLLLNQIDHIDMLEKEGQHEKAQDSLNEDILANAKKRTAQLRTNYSLLENTLHAVETAAGNMWDALLGIGRQETVEHKISETADKLNLLKTNLEYLQTHGSTPIRLEGLKQGILETETALDALRHAKTIDDNKAAADAKAAQANDDAIRKKYDNEAHKFLKGRVDHVGDNFQLSTDSINADAEATLKLADAYSVSDGAVLQAEAHRKALTDATKKDVDQTLLNAREQANLALAIANVVKTSSQQSSNLEYQDTAQTKFNTAVRDGTETSAQAERQMKNEAVLRPLLAAITLAHGHALDEANAAYKRQKDLLIANDINIQTTATLKSNEASKIKLSELQTEIGLAGKSNEERAIAIAQLQEQNKQQLAAGKGVSLSQDALDAINYAGALAKASYELSALKVSEDTFDQSQEKITNSLKASTNALNTNKISLQQYSVDLVHIQQLQLELAAEKSGSWADAAKASLHSLADTGKTVSQQLQTDFKGIFDGLKTGFAQSIGQAIATGQNIRQALVSVLQTAIGGVITDLILMGEQWLINKAFAVTSATASAGAQVAAQATQTGAATASIATITAASVVSANATALAWAPAAALVNAATFGGAATAGGVALAAIAAEAQLLAIPKLKTGGPIGGVGGPKDDSNLIWASKGEYMINADSVNRVGVPFLDAINDNRVQPTGNHFAQGGYIGASTSNVSNDNGQVNHFHFEGANFGGADPDQIEARFEQIMEKVYAPKIINAAVQQSYRTNKKQDSRQKLNVRRGL